MDEFLKEVGVGAAKRMMLKNIKPRLIINESGGKWTLRFESSLKTKTLEFMPDVEFDETTADGREVKVCLYICQLVRILYTCVFRQSFE